MASSQKIIFTIIIFGAIILAIFILGINPQIKAIQKKAQDFLFQKKEQILLKQKIENIKSFEKIYSRNREHLEKINNLFPDSEVPLEFINFLEKLAQDCEISLTIKSSTPSGNKDDLWPSIGFQLTLAGPFPNFLRFLEKLENSPWLIEISGISIKKEEEGIRAVLTTKVFTQ